MKKYSILGMLLTLMLVVSVVFSACGTKATPTPTPTTSTPAATSATPKPTTNTPASTTPTTTTPAVTTTQSPTQPAQQFAKRTWNYANVTNNVFEAWAGLGGKIAEKLGQLTGNAITINPKHAGSLLATADSLPGVANGLAELAYMNAAAFPAQLPSMIMSGVNDPFLTAKHEIEYWSYIASILGNEFLQKEFSKAGVKLLTGIGTCEETLMTTKKISSLDDLKGLRLRQYGGEYQGKFYQAMGAVGVSMPPTEYVDAVKKGTVDGVLTVLSTTFEAKRTEVTPFFTGLPGNYNIVSPPLHTGYVIIMNGKLWSSLNDAEKKALLVATQFGEEYCYKNWKAQGQHAYDSLKADPKNTFTELSLDDVKKLMQQPSVVNQWTEIGAQIDKAGGQGTAMVKRFLELADMNDKDIRALWEKTWQKRIAELW